MAGTCARSADAPTETPTSTPAPISDLEARVREVAVRARDVVPSLTVELKYATTDNFMGKNVYGTFEECYLQADAAHMLAKAAEDLHRKNPHLHLHAYDCARPRSVQLLMWELVKDTPQAPYVADPNKNGGSIHNYGCAIDLTLADEANTPLDMGTPFDHFGPEAHPAKEDELLAAGVLSQQQVENRRLLRQVMRSAGFRPLRHEWWHFDCASRAEALKRYPLIEG